MGMTCYLEEEEEGKKRDGGGGEAGEEMKTSHLRAFIRSQEAGCVKGPLTSTSILPILVPP